MSALSRIFVKELVQQADGRFRIDFTDCHGKSRRIENVSVCCAGGHVTMQDTEVFEIYFEGFPKDLTHG